MDFPCARGAALCLALTVSVGVSAAEAQPAQTPEGAQTFLSALASQGTTRLQFDSSSSWGTLSASKTVNKCVRETTYGFLGDANGWKSRCFDETHSSAVTAPPRNLKAAAPAGTCATKFEFSDYYSGQTVDGWRIEPTGVSSYTVDWKKIAAVTADGSTVHMSPALQGFHVMLPSPELATRVAFAMTFLRQACDPTAATGF